DCGLLVGFPSVVRAPPSSAPIATTATTIAATHAPIALHGCRAQASASLCRVVRFVEDTPASWSGRPFPASWAHPYSTPSLLRRCPLERGVCLSHSTSRVRAAQRPARC